MHDEQKVADTLEIPSQLLKALATDQSANDAFDRLSAHDQHLIIDWVCEGTSEERTQRASDAIEMLKSGRLPQPR